MQMTEDRISAMGSKVPGSGFGGSRFNGFKDLSPINPEPGTLNEEPFILKPYFIRHLTSDL